MTKIIVYSKAGCPFCSLLKMELSKRGLTYVEVDLTDETTRGDFYRATGVNTVPQVFVADESHSLANLSGERIGGWSEVSQQWERLDLQG